MTALVVQTELVGLVEKIRYEYTTVAFRMMCIKYCGLYVCVCVCVYYVRACVVLAFMCVWIVLCW